MKEQFRFSFDNVSINDLYKMVDRVKETKSASLYLESPKNFKSASSELDLQKYRDIYYYGLVRSVQIVGEWSEVIHNAQNFNKISTNENPYYESCKDCELYDSCSGIALKNSQSCDFFRDWCNYLLRPVFFKKMEKIQILSVINLEKIELLIFAINNAIDELERKLWPIRKNIFLHVSEYSEELRAASGQMNLPEWVRATTSGDTAFYHKGAKVTSALVHELTHLFVAQRQLKMPAWLVEGFCEWTQEREFDADFLKASLKNKNLFLLLEKPENKNLLLIDLDQNKPFKNPLYLQAKAFVSYLNEVLGEEKFNKLLTHCESISFEESLLELEGKDLYDFIREFSLRYA